MDEAVINRWKEEIEDACRECDLYQGVVKDIDCITGRKFPAAFSGNVIDAVYGIAGTDEKSVLDVARDVLAGKRAVFEDTVKSWLDDSIYSRNMEKVTGIIYSCGSRCGRGTCCYDIFIGKD